MFVSLTGCLVRQKCVDRNIEPFITLGHILFLSGFIWKKISLLLGDTCPEMSKENKPSSLRYFSSWHILRIKSSWWNNSTFADRCNEQKAIDLTGKHLSLLYWYPVILKEFGCPVQSKADGNFSTAKAALLCLHSTPPLSVLQDSELCRGSLPVTCLCCLQGKIICL